MPTKRPPQFYADRRPSPPVANPDELTPATIGAAVESAIKRAIVALMVRAFVGLLAGAIILAAATSAIRYANY